MPQGLQVSVGQYSDKGRKDINQDFHGVIIPREPLLSQKGVAIVLADGISSSSVSQIASESAVKNFLTDYYCTSESWSVKTSAYRVLAATNSWLHAQTRRGQHPFDRDKGYVCTLSAIVIKAKTAHIFHVGDARIYRLCGNNLEPLTEDHRVVVSSGQSYLGRAMGVNPDIEIDYRALPVDIGDVLVLATDGVHEYVGVRFMIGAIRSTIEDLDLAARTIVNEAFGQGSPDNLTVQIIRIDDVPVSDAAELFMQSSSLPLPPLPRAGDVFDGYRIVREIRSSHRSHIYLATDLENERTVAIKIPSIDQRDDAAYMKRFMMEDWVARRIDNPHVVKPHLRQKARIYQYLAMEYIEGKTLAQWMIDTPRPDLETVRAIVEQIAKGLGAFHRREMIHQDIRPENVMIDRNGLVKIIDLGSTRIAGVVEASALDAEHAILGTLQYTAPEYFLGEAGSPRSDMFSLGVITYQMLTGKLPYGTSVSRLRTRSQQNALRYQTALDDGRETPPWIDGAVERAVHPDPLKRYAELSEFVFDLRHPNPKYLLSSSRPLLERNPLMFWKVVSLILVCIIVVLLAR